MDNKKTFCLAKEGEKIYRVSLNSSKLVENSDGSIIKTLIIDKIETYGDFYTLILTLSDGSRVNVCRNNEVAVIERMPTEREQHPMALFEDFFCQNRKLLFKTVSSKLNDNFERMTDLRSEALMISNSCTVSKRITDSMINLYPEVEKEEIVLTEEQFAEMAL